MHEFVSPEPHPGLHGSALSRVLCVMLLDGVGLRGLHLQTLGWKYEPMLIAI